MSSYSVNVSTFDSETELDEEKKREEESKKIPNLLFKYFILMNDA